MDFFHVWLRRTLHGLSPEIDEAFAEPLGPKWNAEAQDGELIDDAARFAGDRKASKQNYEDGMARAFKRFWEALRDDGRLVIVFANKQPDAWETLVSASSAPGSWSWARGRSRPRCRTASGRFVGGPVVVDLAGVQEARANGPAPAGTAWCSAR